MESSRDGSNTLTSCFDNVMAGEVSALSFQRDEAAQKGTGEGTSCRFNTKGTSQPFQTFTTSS
jgi:hypothetical protein